MLKVFATRSLTIVACACAVAAIGASTAAAAASPPGIEIGPIKASHGFSMTLFDGSCTRQGSALTVEFSKGRSVSITHDYSGGASKCKVSRKLGSGSLSAHWGGLVKIRLSVKNPRKLKKFKRFHGCSGSGGIGRAATVTGTLKISIHRGVFGRIHVHKAKALLDRGANLSCTTKTSTGITAFGTFGPAFLDANYLARGKRSVLISETATLSGSITDDLLISSDGGTNVFNVAPDLSSATIGGAGSTLTGSLTFAGLPVCVGSSPDARNGAFAGALVAHDPVLGAITLTGSAATNVSIAAGTATAGDCNGPYALAATAGFSNLCSADDGLCSVSGSTSTDMFYDSSSAGTQGPIQSETWNFGDGTAPLTIAATPTLGFPLPSPLSHTYANKGTYTVTLTIVDGQGVTHTATGVSYIDA